MKLMLAALEGVVFLIPSISYLSVKKIFNGVRLKVGDYLAAIDFDQDELLLSCLIFN